MSLKKTVEALRKAFDVLEEPLEKYEYIIELGRALPPLDAAYKTENNRVPGCQSTVWLHAYEREGKLYFEADADALIVRGLVALLIRIYSKRHAQTILKYDPALLEPLGLSEIITAGRQNGVASMLKRIYDTAKEHDHEGK